jgi:hypothetical protein
LSLHASSWAREKRVKNFLLLTASWTRWNPFFIAVETINFKAFKFLKRGKCCFISRRDDGALWLMPARWVFALNGAHLGQLFSSAKEFYANFARRALLPFDFTARPRFTASDSVASFQFKLARAEGKSFTRATRNGF